MTQMKAIGCLSQHFVLKKLIFTLVAYFTKIIEMKLA